MVKFYRCQHCGNIIIKLHDSKVPVICCGEKMEELIPNTKDAAIEKHIPVMKPVEGGVEVSVGSTLHPMTEEHYIEWIYVETKQGSWIKYFSPEQDSTYLLPITEEEIKTVYAYCNLHGLWQAK